MRRYETRESVVYQRVEVEARCDGCGVTEDDAQDGRLVAVEIAINDGEEMGRRDYLDYCDPCIIVRAPAFITAGSRAEYVTGETPPPDEDDDV